MNTIKEVIHKTREKTFNEKIKPLAEKYEIEDVDALAELYARLEILAEYGSEAKIKEGSIFLAEGEGTWSETKKLLNNALNGANQLYECLDTIGEHYIALQAINEFCDSDTYINTASSLQENIEKLVPILTKAQKIENNGRPRRKDWSYEAVKLCKEFWQKYTSKETKVYFVEKNAAIPANEFTEWFCDIMKLAANTPATKCQTFLGD